MLAVFMAMLAIIGLSAATATAQGTLNLYCSVQIEWCQAMATNFQRDTGIRVNMTQRGSGETLAAMRAEAQNPRGDVWFGGTGDPHLAAGEENLTQAHESPNRAQLHPWALTQWRQSKQRAVGVYAGAVGFGINTELLARKGLKAPGCWSDLVDPRFKGEIQVANPNSSGTAYVIIATLVQIMGEDPAFAYLRQLHPNVNAYTRSGTAPIKAVARGETGISLSFVHDAVTERNAGFPVAYATPCEGTGYEIGSMSILRGARNLAEARRFYDWALTEAAQRLGFEAGGQLQTPSNKAAPIPPNAPDLSKIRLIEYDFARYGAAAERKRLIERWDRDVGALPR
ncbi:MAG: ABC transporter substrate-binding protein [Alphaproteobacteria bacterium]|nr:ABC transporter substrate-binding protein [Alphaproteobacteria bacterium]